jgi:hypothetical protein
MMRLSTDTTVERVSRVACAPSTNPESSKASETLERMTAVLRSITSATTAGEGGNGTFDAKERFDKAEARGVRVKADLARVVAGSTSESSLGSKSAWKSQFLAMRLEDA